MGLFDFLKKDKKESITINGRKIEINEDTFKLAAEHDKAVELYGQKKYREAIDVLDKLIAKRPDFRQYYCSRGTVYEDMYNDVMAEKDFKKAVQLDPKDSLSQFRLAMLYHRKNDLHAAIEHLQISYDHHPFYDDLLGKGVYNNILFIHKRVVACNLGNFLTQVGRYEEGYQILDEVIENCPDYAFPYFAKAHALARQEKYQEALKYAIKAEEYGHPSARQLKDTLILAGAQAAQSTQSVDKYTAMINNARHNPLKITADPRLQSPNRMPDITHVFRNELVGMLNNPALAELGYRGIIGGYAYSMILSYYQNAGFVPKNMVDQILEMVYKAIKTSEYSYTLKSLEELKDGVYPQLFTEDE